MFNHLAAPAPRTTHPDQGRKGLLRQLSLPWPHPPGPGFVRLEQGPWWERLPGEDGPSRVGEEKAWGEAEGGALGFTCPWGVSLQEPSTSSFSVPEPGWAFF